MKCVTYTYHLSNAMDVYWLWQPSELLNISGVSVNIEVAVQNDSVCNGCHSVPLFPDW